MSQYVSYHYNVHGKTVSLQLEELYSGDFGTTIWPSSDLLAKLIFQNEDFFRNKTVLELGCGPGLAGIAAAKCGSHVFLTDLDTPSSILDNCKQNCVLNHVVESTVVQPLQWGLFTEAFFALPTINILIGSDLFYDTRNLDDLLCTISVLKKQNPSCKLLFLFPERISVHTVVEYFQRWEISVHFQPLSIPDSIHQMILGTSDDLEFANLKGLSVGRTGELLNGMLKHYYPKSK